MKMLLHAIATAFALGMVLLASPVEAGFKKLQDAYELAPSQVRLPNGPGGQGTLVVQMCPKCSRSSLVVTAATEWRIGRNSPPITAAEFRSQYQGAALRPGASVVFVYYEPRTRVVDRIVLALRTPRTAS